MPFPAGNALSGTDGSMGSQIWIRELDRVICRALLKGGASLRVIGLTGGIACGKSTVSGWLREQPDCRVLDGDLLSRELTASGGAALPLIRECFGDSVFSPEGALNRRALGRVVFSSDRAREQLDALMAPLLRDLTLQRLQEARDEGVSLCFLDFPLLFEKGYDALCDTVWCVYLPRDLQLRRLMARDGLSEDEALSRMDAVLSSEDKAARSQVVIDNSGEIAFTLSMLPSLLEAERQAAVPPRRRRSNRPAPADPSAPAEPREARLPESDGPRKALSDPLLSPDAPAVMERPTSARKGNTPQKVPWKLPAWLVALLFSFAALLAVGVTAQLLMRAYLTRQAEQHLAEENAIFANYPLEYRGLIEENAAEFQLNPAFVSSIVRNESSFQPMAESGVGARGLMQLMPDTAEWIAGKMKISGYAFTRMYDPGTNLRFGCWYLRYLSSLFHGDPVCVACAYHAGQGQVTAWLSDPALSDDGVFLSLEKLADGPTKTYARRVIRAYGIYQTLYFTDSVPDDDLSHDPSRDAGVRQ